MLDAESGFEGEGFEVAATTAALYDLAQRVRLPSSSCQLI